MIKTIVSASPFMVVNSGSTPYVNSNPNSGAMRYNTQSQSVEICDGYNWVPLSSHATVDLTPEATDLLMWARKKRQEELEFESLAAKHPGLRDLKEKLELFTILVKEENANANR